MWGNHLYQEKEKNVSLFHGSDKFCHHISLGLQLDFDGGSGYMRLASTAYSFSGSHIDKFEIHFKQEYGYVAYTLVRDSHL